jgi:hypothetical protein
VDLAGLDYKNVSSAALEGLAAYCPNSPAFTDELDLVIRMPVRTGPEPGFPWNRNTETLVLPAQLRQTHANCQQKAGSLGARDTSFVTLLPRFGSANTNK